MNSGRVYALVLRLTADKNIAVNLTKKIFVTSYEQISYFRFDKLFSSWLIGITVYSVLESMRIKKSGAGESNRKKNPSKSKEEKIKVNNAKEFSFADNILLLPEQERLVFVLHDVEKYTEDETADILFMDKNEMNEILENAHQLLGYKGNFINSIKSLQEKIASLPLKIDPPFDLWKEIFSGLTQIRSKKYQENKEQVIEIEEATEEITSGKARKKGKHWAGELKGHTFESAGKEGIFKNKKGLFLTSGIVLSVLIVLIIAAYFIFIAGSPNWKVSASEGSPLLNGKKLNSFSSLSEGDTLRTNLNSGASIKIKELGQIEIKPGTILQRLKNNFGLKLDIGSIMINENQTSKLLTVIVPDAVIRDYYPGSLYSINLNDTGTSVIFVKKSWLKISSGKTETFVTPGCYAQIIFGRGTGIPYRQNSSKDFIADLSRFSFNSYSTDLLNKILSESTFDNAISLWNIIRRINNQERLKVVNTLEKFAPLPAGTTDVEMVDLNEQAMLKWLTEIANR